jgi:hypothetical protein
MKTPDAENDGDEKSLPKPPKCVTGQMRSTNFSPFSIG